jgi:hypothetical protein
MSASPRIQSKLFDFIDGRRASTINTVNILLGASVLSSGANPLPTSLSSMIASQGTFLRSTLNDPL